MDKLFIFDYDDTLAENLIYYTRAKLKFVLFTAEALGPNAPDPISVLKLQEEIDVANVPKYGFAKERFPTSMTQAYKAICERTGVSPSEQAMTQAYAIGEEAFVHKGYRNNGLMPGVMKTLDFLRQQGDELMLYTKGDEEIQWSKINATGVKRWFGENIHVVADKDADGVRRIVGDHDPLRVWKIGNGLKSDVYPALEAGIGAIYVPWETWAFERQHSGEPDHPRYVKLPAIEDMVDRYSTLP